ncbi:MAG: SpoIIE family protein phosphatase [Crocinitomix sp.]|nr:SpoIIE family protein phosphatase [Crocinitomix sp.]
MLKQLPYFILFVLLHSCGESTVETGDQVLTEGINPIVVPLNMDEGYLVNQYTNDSVFPQINSVGDTIPTGVAIEIQGDRVLMDSMQLPFVISAQTPLEIKAESNVFPIGTAPKQITINWDNLPVYNLKESDTTFKLVDKYGNNVKTGVPISVSPRTKPCKHPDFIEALAPDYKGAPSINVQHLDVDEGMNASYVQDMIEDQYGNIWMATRGGGLSKYDGSHFWHFTRENGLPGNNIKSIFEDSQGNIWFGVKGQGICKYDGLNFESLSGSEGFLSHYVFAINEDYSGNLWFATNQGLVKYDGEALTYYTTNEGLSDNNIREIYIDQDENLWVGTLRGGLNKFDGEAFVHLTVKEGLIGNHVTSIQNDLEGNIWVSTFDGISKLQGDVLTNYTTKQGLSDNKVIAIGLDKDGNLWFGTSNAGINKLDLSANNNKGAFVHYKKENGLTSDNVSKILVDSGGNLWLGSWGLGVSKFNQGSFRLLDNLYGKNNLTIRSLFEDSKGNIWFGGNGLGINKHDGQTIYHYPAKEIFSNRNVACMLEDEAGNIWFGTKGGGMARFDGEQFLVFTTNQGLSHNYVESLLQDDSGNLWACTPNGINQLIKSSNGFEIIQFTEANGLVNDYIRSACNGQNGELWFCTEEFGIIRYEPIKGDKTKGRFTSFTEREGLSDNELITIKNDNQGNIWIGTKGGGLNKFKPPNAENSQGSFTYYTVHENLTDDKIRSINFDRKNRIWVGTIKGISILDFGEHEVVDFDQHPKRIIGLTKQDGLMGQNIYGGVGLIDSRNRGWWGTGKGLTQLHLEEYEIDHTPPRIHLRSVGINTQFHDYHAAGLKDSLGFKYSSATPHFNYPQDLELDYDHNHISFYFTGIDWKAPHKIVYSYKMDGREGSNWSVPSKDNKADYRNLTHGNYTFKVRAKGIAEEWSAPFEYTFSIHPPWWHTWWARIGYFVFFGILIFGFVSWRTNKLKQRQKELESEVEAATREIIQKRDELEHQKAVIENAHREITDSIAYAKRIQHAILPPMNLVKQQLPNSFVLYLPKDVVAGDFYWMEQREELTLFAVGDCTGHGVPGAMVSIVCINALNRAVREFNLSDPAEILDKTRALVVREFAQKNQEVSDGMDIALCALQGNKLIYAGAYNPLWIIRGGELLETKANKQPIGSFDRATPFTSHSFELEPADVVYIMSDGFQDQFGGEKGKKFKSGKLKKLIVSIQDQSLAEQKDLMRKTFIDWKMDFEQVDDVCIIGVKHER